MFRDYENNEWDNDDFKPPSAFDIKALAVVIAVVILLLMLAGCGEPSHGSANAIAAAHHEYIHVTTPQCKDGVCH